MQANDMAPLTAWLPARPSDDCDLIIKIVGTGASRLLKEWRPIAQFLADRGFFVMAQSDRLSGDGGVDVLHIRLAAGPFHSLGDGCDVLIYLRETVRDVASFDLQPGSVLLWEPPPEPRLHPALPEGVIVYPLPLAELGGSEADGCLGKGLAALGALLYLLGAPEEIVPHVIAVGAAPGSFVAGWQFAHRALRKRDAYALPFSTTTGEAHRIILTLEQAIMIGFGVSACECQATCEQELIRAPAQWVMKHAGMAGETMSVLQSDRHPGVEAYRGPQGNVMALLTHDDFAVATCLKGVKDPRGFVAADIPDALALVIAGHDLIRNGLSDGVEVVIEHTLAQRQQSVALSAVQGLFQRRTAAARDLVMAAQCGGADEAPGLSAEDGRDGGGIVGFVAWGAAQGVVRDAVALCRSVGLHVTGWYPNVIVPFPKDGVEGFAKTVDRVVLVESSQTHGYEERLRGACSFPFTVLRPSSGKSLTPMDIFLREGLGTA